MYLKILLIVFQCFLPRFVMYQLTSPAARAMSSLVPIMANIKLPTADAYGT
jgi:hypothetical protein